MQEVTRPEPSAAQDAYADPRKVRRSLDPFVGFGAARIIRSDVKSLGEIYPLE